MFDDPNSQDSLAELEYEVWMAFDIRDGYMGASCLNFEQKKLRIIEDNLDAANSIEITKSLICQLSPTRIFISNMLPENILNSLKSAVVERRFDVETVPSAVFNTDCGKSLLEEIYGHYPDMVLERTFQLMQSSTDMNVSLGTINVLHTKFDNRHQIDRFFDYINRWENISLDKTMFIDVDSLYSLQILPLKVKNSLIYNKKYKTSLLDLLNKTISPSGSHLLKSWLISPSYDLALIQDRQHLVGLLCHQDNSGIVTTIRLGLRRISKFPSCLLSIKVGKLAWIKWKGVVNFLHDISIIISQIRKIDKGLSATNDFPRLIRKLLSVDVDLIAKIEQHLLHFIDSKQSDLHKKVCLQTGIDSLLDELRIKYDELESVLQLTTADADSAFVLKNQVNMVYIPQIGFLMCYTNDSVVASPIEDQNLLSTWKLLFTTNSESYYKNDLASALDETYGDIYELIADREIELISQLKDVIIENEGILSNVFDMLTELDCVCSLAVVSSNCDYVKPELVDDGHILDIVQGRHPLIETAVSFVANDVHLSTLDEASESILVVTGANLSGKSVYLNQTALIVVMAQIGCFVPCESARIGIVDKILTRIMSRETVDKNVSTFAIDIHQLSKCLLLTTPRSLLIIDEFGKGCDSFDGPALFGSTVRYLLNLKHCPKTLMSTHFHELFVEDLELLGGQEVKERLKFCYLNVRLNSRSSSAITYLHQVRSGIGFESFGNYCAKVCGIPNDIVERANNISDCQAKGLNFLENEFKFSDGEDKDSKVAQSSVNNFLALNLQGNQTGKEYIDQCIAQFEKCIGN